MQVFPLTGLGPWHLSVNFPGLQFLTCKDSSCTARVILKIRNNYCGFQEILFLLLPIVRQVFEIRHGLCTFTASAPTGVEHILKATRGLDKTGQMIHVKQ